MAPTLKRLGSNLASGSEQLRILNTGSELLQGLPQFASRLGQCGLTPLRPTGIEILQINLGKLCNQTCKHCHVDAGPDRTEVMSRETMEHCIRAVRENKIKTVDLTGGAPEMNPNFRWFVEEIRPLVSSLIVRCNLTIILANRSYNDLPEFFSKNRVTVVSSLPYYDKSFTDRQRGDGVFDRSIQALKRLNAAGYGEEGTGLELNLVYNPCGAFLPGSQAELESDFKRELFAKYAIKFNSLYTITNLPISRFLSFLLSSGNLDEYMEKLVSSFNSGAAANVMCRNTLSVGWNGDLFDCDFNQMLEIPVKENSSRNIRSIDWQRLTEREIAVDQHCYGCTAGAGSSCGGATV